MREDDNLVGVVAKLPPAPLAAPEAGKLPSGSVPTAVAELEPPAPASAAVSEPPPEPASPPARQRPGDLVLLAEALRRREAELRIRGLGLFALGVFIGLLMFAVILGLASQTP